VSGPRVTVDLWVVDLDRWVAAATATGGPTDQDRARAGRLADPTAARRLLARRSLTRSLLAGALGVDPAGLVIDRRCPTCGGTDHGRPVVRGTPVEFSVSSSAQIAAVAVSGAPVGVDVELVRRGIVPLPRALSDRERDELGALPDGRQGEEFLRLWTAKEAVLKASGQDLADDPSRIDVAGLLTAGSVTVASAGRTWVVRHPVPPPALGARAVVAVADARGAEVVSRSVGDRPPRDAS